MVMAGDVGEGIFFAGQNHVALRVVASEDEHVIITTNPEEIIKKELLKTAPKTKTELFPREESLLEKRQPQPQPPQGEGQSQRGYPGVQKKKAVSQEYYSREKKVEHEKPTPPQSQPQPQPQKEAVVPEKKKSQRVRYTVDQYAPPEVFKDEN